MRRVVERVVGARLTERDAERAMVRVGRPLHGRDRLLALMDVGATRLPTAGAALRRMSVAATMRDPGTAPRRDASQPGAVRGQLPRNGGDR